jgi:diamine N-acetyltransferase
MISLRKARFEDLPFLMALEQETCRQGFTGTNSEEEHRGWMQEADYAYWIIEEGGDAAGFVILSGLASGNRSILIKRVAVAAPGRGLGREAMRQVLRLAFDTYGAHRVWLDVYPENERARRAYRALGFQEEGLMRECIWSEGQFRSLILMSVLETDPGARQVRNA